LYRLAVAARLIKLLRHARLSGCGSGAFHQSGNGVAQLSPFALPMADTLQLQAQRFLTFRYERIVEADAFDEATIAAIARIRHDYIVKWAIFGTTTGKTNNDHKKPINN
jgi:hypothetical protein